MRPRKSYFCSTLLFTLRHSFLLQLPTIPTTNNPQLLPLVPPLSLPLTLALFCSPLHSAILFYSPSNHPFPHSLTLTHAPSRSFILLEHTHTRTVVTVYSITFTNPMLRLTKSFPFFQAQEESLASTFIAPSNGYNISVPTRNGLDHYYGPGTIFQGQLNLQLLKPIKGPCRLRVILACTQTIGDIASSTTTSTSPGEDRSSPRASQSSETSSTGSHKHSQYPPPRTVFAVEHILLQDMAMAIKRHTFLFTVKFPMCNFPPSFQV